MTEEAKTKKRAYQKRWSDENRDRLNATARKRYAENRESVLAYQSAYRKANIDRINEKARERQKANPVKREPDLNSILKGKYGITLKDYNRLLDEQCGVCAGCGLSNPINRRLSVDHCHDTGKVRGLLCHHCNIGIGHLRHDPKLLRKMAEYCENTSGASV
jgi:hypothetical protein